MKKTIIELWDSVGLGIIIALPTGIMVSNQTGGTACLHPRIEGIFLPLANDYIQANKEFLSPELDLINYFEGEKYRGSGATNGIDIEDVEEINSIIANAKLDEFIEIDLDKLNESHEAWIRIKINNVEEWDLIKGFNESYLIGVLTWSNSD